MQHVNDQNLLEGLDLSLSSWTWPDGKKDTYTFALQQPELFPTLQLVDRDGVVTDYCWSPKDYTIISGGGWTYKVGEIKQKFGLPRIERTNEAGKDEFINVDNVRGVTEEKTIEGGHKVIEVFKSSGPLYGKVRKIEKIEDGVRRSLYTASYDQLGRLIRETDEAGFSTAFIRDENGVLTGKKSLKTRDEEILRTLGRKEKLLLEAIANVKSVGTKNSKLQELGLFYIHELKEPEKALALVGQMVDPQLIYNLKLHAASYNENYSRAQKIEVYTMLLEEFPEKKAQLEFMIKHTREKMQREDNI